MNNTISKGIYPVEDGSRYGEILYAYTDIEEAKRDYLSLTGEPLDEGNCQHLNVEATENGFSWRDQQKGTPSIICIY